MEEEVILIIVTLSLVASPSVSLPYRILLHIRPSKNNNRSKTHLPGFGEVKSMKTKVEILKIGRRTRPAVVM
jgi:hypothetical protein